MSPQFVRGLRAAHREGDAVEVRREVAAVHPLLEVQVRAGAAAGAADLADELSLVDALPDGHPLRQQVGVERAPAAAVVDHHVAAVAAAAEVDDAGHHARGRRGHQRAEVVGLVPVDRVVARAVAGRGSSRSTCHRRGRASRSRARRCSSGVRRPGHTGEQQASGHQRRDRRAVVGTGASGPLPQAVGSEQASTHSHNNPANPRNAQP